MKIFVFEEELYSPYFYTFAIMSGIRGLNQIFGNFVEEETLTASFLSLLTLFFEYLKLYEHSQNFIEIYMFRDVGRRSFGFCSSFIYVVGGALISATQTEFF